MATNQPIEHCSKNPSRVGFYWGPEFKDDHNHEFKQVLDSDAAADVADDDDDDHDDHDDHDDDDDDDDDDDECIG